MRVKIVKCSDTMYWYRSSIGEVFDARKGPEGAVIVIANDGYTNYIFKNDWELVVDVNTQDYVTILQASGMGMWYDRQVGSSFPIVWESPTAYWCKVQGNNNAWVYRGHCNVRSF